MKKLSKKSIIIILLITIFLTSLLYLLYRFNIIEHKSYDNEYFGIEAYTSEFDNDNDGIDDVSDIMLGVRNYIETKPVYKSKYYETGYPNDSYGVCTDVVAQGFLNAGYDLMELVNEHIKENRELYNIDVIDKNIDFRRVRNLYVYFENTAIKLTTDVYDIEKWQAGDVVVFKNHVGIVSDKRNKNGVPFLIHHYSKFQLRYEENILEFRNDIIGHYRIN